MAGLPVLQDVTEDTQPERPSWIRVRAPGGERYTALRRLIEERRLHTVCSSAACPNIGECWNAGTATFMILGNECTRACRFCDVKTSTRPRPIDLDEPARLGEAAALMELEHVVITSVTRDDAPDGGAAQFARCIEEVRARLPEATLEVLTPDFGGDESLLKIVTDARPEIFNHNLETVARLTREIRSGAKYERSLALLKAAKAQQPDMRTKSGIMLGLGETDEEAAQAVRDLREADVDILTIGQYLRPSPKHHPVVRYAPPESFAELGRLGESLGFAHVESGPLVRSSYHAERGVAAKGC
jgi:lipoic acid synthetase